MALILRRLASTRPPNFAPIEYFSQCSKTNPSLALTKDESTYISWHKKEDFPYECTKPLPEIKVEDNDTVLKTKLTSELMQTLNKKTPDAARLELMSITHTSKHRWFRRARDKKAKTTPMERKYL